MAVIYEAQERISFAAEGVALAAADAFDVARDHATALLASIAAVAGVLALAVSGGGESSGSVTQASSSPATGTPAYVSEEGFSLSLPEGWERAETPDGSNFSAISSDGLAESTLWVDRDADLGFTAFVEQSKANLDEIATGVRVADTVDGPTMESKIAELRAEVPLDGGLVAAYRVTLRAAGPYRYYLATSVQPGAPSERLADAEVLGASFRPEAG